jgi:hypothetical protein
MAAAADAPHVAVKVVRAVRIPVRDGIRLAATLY